MRSFSLFTSSTFQFILHFLSTFSLSSFYSLSFLYIFPFSSVSVFYIQEMSTSSVLSSLILAATVNANPIKFADSRFDALDIPFTNELTGSAVSVQSVELGHYRYKEAWIVVEKIADPTFPLCSIQRGDVKDIVASMCVLVFDYPNGTINTTWSGECIPKYSFMKDAIVEQGDQKFVSEGFKKILLDGRHHCCAVRQLQPEDEHWCADSPVRVVQDIHRNGHAAGYTEAIKLS